MEKFRKILEKDRTIHSKQITYKKITSILEEYDEFLTGLRKAFEMQKERTSFFDLGEDGFRQKCEYGIDQSFKSLFSLKNYGFNIREESSIIVVLNYTSIIPISVLAWHEWH